MVDGFAIEIAHDYLERRRTVAAHEGTLIGSHVHPRGSRQRADSEMPVPRIAGGAD